MNDEAAVARNLKLMEDGTWRGSDYTPPPCYYPARIETTITLSDPTAALVDRGYSATEVAKLPVGNWLRTGMFLVDPLLDLARLGPWLLGL